MTPPILVSALGTAVVPPVPQSDDPIRDPLARWAADEASEGGRKNRQPDRRDPLSRLVGCHVWQEGVTMLDVRLRYSATFWRVYPEKRLAFDRLDAGVTAESVAWRGEVARSHGFRWVPMERGKATRDFILRAAGIEEAA